MDSGRGGLEHNAPSLRSSVGRLLGHQLMSSSRDDLRGTTTLLTHCRRLLMKKQVPTSSMGVANRVHWCSLPSLRRSSTAFDLMHSAPKLVPNWRLVGVSSHQPVDAMVLGRRMRAVVELMPTIAAPPPSVASITAITSIRPSTAMKLCATAVATAKVVAVVATSSTASGKAPPNASTSASWVEPRLETQIEGFVPITKAMAKTTIPVSRHLPLTPYAFRE